jgi:acetolactate synthase-1/2/3 large subunit
VDSVRQAGALKRQTQTDQAKRAGQMNFSWVSHCVAEALQEDDVLLNEFDLDADAVPRAHHGTYYGISNAGGLGWGIGAALGLKLAEPERTVVLATGDGGYYFGNPAAGHAVANTYNLPFLTIVFNNAKWATVVTHTNRNFPHIESANLPLTGLGPHPNFEKIVEAFNGYGECVSQPAELPGALQRVLGVVRHEGRQGLVNIIC